MDRNRAKELVPILQAFADGEDIQFRPYQYNPDIEDVPDWSDLPEQEELMITFPADDYEYRIKPKPREWEVLPDTDGCSLSIRQSGEGDRGWIKVREVE